MRSSTKWISGFLLGMMMSPACHHNVEPANGGSGVAPDAGTLTEQPSDRPGIEPDTGAPIGPVANPRSQYQDGLLAQPIAGSGGTGAVGGIGPIGGAAGSGGTGLVPAPRYVVAL